MSARPSIHWPRVGQLLRELADEVDPPLEAERPRRRAAALPRAAAKLSIVPTETQRAAARSALRGKGLLTDD